MVKNYITQVNKMKTIIEIFKAKEEGEFVCVDGLQRLSAIIAFLNNEIPAFDILYKDFEGNTSVSISVRINDLKTRKEVLQWYIDLNTGGTIHTEEEIEKVKKLLEQT